MTAIFSLLRLIYFGFFVLFSVFACFIFGVLFQRFVLFPFIYIVLFIGSTEENIIKKGTVLKRM